MAIFINETTRVIVQGMTGSEGTKHTRRMIASGTLIVGGVTPGKGGQVVEIEGKALPVFNTVAEAVAATGATAAEVTVYFPQTMRIAPTAVEYSTLNLWDGNTQYAASAVGLQSNGTSTSSSRLSVTTSGNTAYRWQQLIANNSTSAYIGMSAEL